VEITRPFYLATTEVTVGQFRTFVEANPKHALDDERWKDPGFTQADDYPVVYISWRNAADFCAWLSKTEGREYRLPTEAEWEYACRAGRSGTRYCFGDDAAQLEQYAWYGRPSDPGTRAVGQKRPNDWGLFDMHGNVWEWCQDYHDFDFYRASPTKDPKGPSKGSNYVKRGGAWCFGIVEARCAFRSTPGGGVESGFRVALTVPPGGVRPEGVK
jgi:formylglycine-generating enzyme required for sulfatase activity